MQARFAREHVTIEGRDSRWSRVGDDGGRITFHFCPDCGATVYYECDDFMPGFVAVPVGAFADPKFPPPTTAVYGSRRHAWVVTPGLNLEELD